MTGRVTLVGGGPGPVDLLTVRAVRALGSADVVLYDRLAPRDDLAALAPRAELVDVGKTPGHHAVPQAEIEAMMVARAAAGAHVVRLKGGDPYVLGRGGEEVLACRAAGVPVEVVPGISSAIAVPAAAGIPVTHRDVSRAFTVVSGHAPLSESELAGIAALGGTVVVLMGVAALPALVTGLARHGLAATTPVAIVERGHRPGQRTTIGTLADIVATAGLARIASPAVVVVGEVVRLAEGGAAGAREVMGRAERLAEDAS